MTDQIVVAFIGAGATLLAALISVFGAQKAQDLASSSYRNRFGLPNPLSRWKCNWLNEDGSLYVSDEVKIERWIKNGRFHGTGIQPALSY